MGNAKHAPTLISIYMPPHSTTWHLRMYKGRELIGEAQLEDVHEVRRKEVIALLEGWRNEVEYELARR